jgi:hypothetical protein
VPFGSRSDSLINVNDLGVSDRRTVRAFCDQLAAYATNVAGLSTLIVPSGQLPEREMLKNAVFNPQIGNPGETAYGAHSGSSAWHPAPSLCSA